MDVMHKLKHLRTWKSDDKVMKGYVAEKRHLWNTSSPISNLGEVNIIQVSYYDMEWRELLRFCSRPVNISINIIYVTNGRELSFLAIYFGVDQEKKDGVRATPYTTCMIKLPRTDRHGVTRQHVYASQK